jgi:hypothetical protein
MSIIKIAAQTAAATGEEAANTTPMLTPEEVVAQLRGIRERIPEFVQLPASPETLRIRRAAKLNIEFAQEAFSTVGASEAIQGVIGNSPDELHQAQDEAGRWAAVESELHALLRGVSSANLIRRQRIAQAAVQAYNVSRELVKQQDYAHLLPHVERMKRLPKFGRRRAKPGGEPQSQSQLQPKTD